MNQRGRKYRIRQAKRKKQKAAKQLRDSDRESSSKAIGIHSNTPTRCSCVMCGNPRNHLGNSKHGKTISELSSSDSIRLHVLD